MSVIICGSEEIIPAREVCHQPMRPFPVRVKPLKKLPALPEFQSCFPPCCYDFPCKATCFNAPACMRPSGRYACRAVFPGKCPPPVPKCPHNYRKKEKRDPEKCYEPKCCGYR